MLSQEVVYVIFGKKTNVKPKLHIEVYFFCLNWLLSLMCAAANSQWVVWSWLRKVLKYNWQAVRSAPGPDNLSTQWFCCRENNSPKAIVLFFFFYHFPLITTKHSGRRGEFWVTALSPCFAITVVFRLMVFSLCLSLSLSPQPNPKHSNNLLFLFTSCCRTLF